MLPVRGCHPVSLAFPDHSSHILGSAGPRSLATTCGVSVDFLSSGYLDVSVPRVRSLKPMCSVSKYLARPIIDTQWVTITDRQVGCPIRRSMDHGLLPAPHGLSQVITSFIASCCQGIHQTPFSRLIRPGKSKALPDQKQYFPGHPPWFETDAVLVSVLDLDRCVPAPGVPGTDEPPLGPISTQLMCISLNDVKFVRDRTREGTVCPRGSYPDVLRRCLRPGLPKPTRHPNPIDWWSVSGSNR